MAVAVLVFVAVGMYAIRDFPRGAIDHARWWLLAITCLFGPLPTVALNGAEYIAQARTVGVRVPFLEGIRVSILATAANLLPVPGSALVRTHALAAGGSGYRRASMTTLAVGTAWIGATATLVAIVGSTTGAPWASAAIGGAGLAFLATTYALLRRAEPPTGVGDMFWRIVAIETASALVGAVRFFAILYALGIDISAPQAMALALASVIASASGVFPSGIGIREALAGTIGAIVGLPAATGVAASATDRIASLVVVAALAGWLTWHKRSQRRHDREGPT